MRIDPARPSASPTVIKRPDAKRVGGATLELNGTPLPMPCARKAGEWTASVAHHVTREANASPIKLTSPIAMTPKVRSLW